MVYFSGTGVLGCWCMNPDGATGAAAGPLPKLFGRLLRIRELVLPKIMGRGLKREAVKR